MPEEAHKLSTSEPYKSMSLCRKLLLSAALIGNDVSVAFIQLYEVSVTQVLGVPISYVTLTSIVSGPSAMILMNILAYFSDKGQNHRQKKMAVLVFSSSMILSGMVVLVMASTLVMSRNVDSTAEENESVTDDVHTGSFYENNQVANMTVPHTTVARSLRSWNSSAVTKLEQEVDLLSLPLSGVLGLLGFLTMDIGYDINTASSRSCILACSSPHEHSFLLVVALVMAGAGGCLISLLGTLDLSAVFHTSGDRLLTQLTVQSLVCMTIVIVCLLSTIVTALLNIRQLDGHAYTPVEEDQAAEEENAQCYGTLHRDEVPLQQGENNQADETSSLSAQETSLSETWSDSDQTSASANSADEENGDREMMLKKDGCNGRAHAPRPKQKNASLEHGKKLKSSDQQQEQCGRPTKRPRSKCVIACITCYLGASGPTLYSMYVAHFLGKEVKGGDSSAPPGSDKLHAYEDAANIAASGQLLFFCCYMGVGLVHKRLMTFWGLKVDFSLSHALMAAAILSLTLSKQVALYYVCCVVYGFQRSALLSVPFIIADNYAHEQTAQGQVHGSAVGKAMAVVTSMIPLNYCTLYFVSGPLITLTHYDGAPLILASVSTFLAAVIFLLYQP